MKRRKFFLKTAGLAAALTAWPNLRELFAAAAPEKRKA